MWDKWYRYLFVSLSMACYGLAVGLTPQLVRQTNVSVGWYPQIIVLISISAAASVVAYLVPHLGLLLAILTLKIVLLAILLYPWYGSVEFSLCVSIPLVLELSLLVRPPFGGIVAFAAVVGVQLSPHIFGPWHGRFVQTGPIGQVTILATVVIVATVAGIARIRSDRSRHLESETARLEKDILRLTSANASFQQYADAVQEKSSANERKRIAREIHDTVGYTLTNILAMIEACKDLAVQGKMDDQMQWLERVKIQAQEGFEEAHRAVRELRATESDLPKGLNLIQRVISTFQEVTKIEIDVQYGNMPQSAGKEVDEVIYHLVQEALTNAIRHGRATRAWLYFWRDETEIKISIRDNGRGSDDVHEGSGLKGMRERIEALGGSVRAQSATPGFVVHAQIPARRTYGQKDGAD